MRPVRGHPLWNQESCGWSATHPKPKLQLIFSGMINLCWKNKLRIFLGKKLETFPFESIFPRTPCCRPLKQYPTLATTSLDKKLIHKIRSNCKFFTQFLKITQENHPIAGDLPSSHDILWRPLCTCCHIYVQFRELNVIVPHRITGHAFVRVEGLIHNVRLCRRALPAAHEQSRTSS